MTDKDKLRKLEKMCESQRREIERIRIKARYTSADPIEAENKYFKHVIDNRDDTLDSLIHIIQSLRHEKKYTDLIRTFTQLVRERNELDEQYAHAMTRFDQVFKENQRLKKLTTKSPR